MSQPDFVFLNVLRKYSVEFASLFSNIWINRIDPYGGPNTQMLVPITWGAKSKPHLDQKQNVDLPLRPHEVLLPRMAYLITGMQYDPERNLPQSLKWCFEGQTIIMEGSPVPYNIQYVLSIYAKTFRDMHEILEQVVWRFAPYYTVQIEEAPNFHREIPIILQDVSTDIQADMDESPGSIRILQYHLTFMLKGYFYPPIRDANLIRWVRVNYLNENAYGYRDDLYEVDPYGSEPEDSWQIKHTTTEGDDVKIQYRSKP